MQLVHEDQSLLRLLAWIRRWNLKVSRWFTNESEPFVEVLSGLHARLCTDCDSLCGAWWVACELNTCPYKLVTDAASSVVWGDSEESELGFGTRGELRELTVRMNHDHRAEDLGSVAGNQHQAVGREPLLGVGLTRPRFGDEASPDIDFAEQFENGMPIGRPARTNSNMPGMIEQIAIRHHRTLSLIDTDSLRNRGDRTPAKLYAAQIGLWSMGTLVLVSP